ncbi:hypothetical protein J22TS1_43430 [Siminovitchia terrae]|uniref:hypothetical protein n=1 Tax=Siminovitchia terrae TaxID=1914933 RepID=UPI001B0943E1|nr:hypothetical protein [Siminovitchia terrae]GIN93292.1 hypothetical protein J22TS1_43430 [Siminovitchia terrae]
MSEKNDQGVKITLREIYDDISVSLRELNEGMERMEGRIIRLEERTSIANDADMRSKEALDIAKEALRVSKEVQQEITQTQQERKENRKWLYRTIVGGLISWLITFLLGILAVYLISNGGGVK